MMDGIVLNDLNSRGAYSLSVNNPNISCLGGDKAGLPDSDCILNKVPCIAVVGTVAVITHFQSRSDEKIEGQSDRP